MMAMQNIGSLEFSLVEVPTKNYRYNYINVVLGTYCCWRKRRKTRVKSSAQGCKMLEETNNNTEELDGRKS